MRHGDTPEQHKRKVARKVAELQAKGWSSKRIKNYLKSWAMITGWANNATR